MKACQIGEVIASREAQNVNSQVRDLASSQKEGLSKALLDLSELASRMARDRAILYANPAPRSGADWPQFRGLIRLLENGQQVLARWTNSQSISGTGARSGFMPCGY